MSESADLDGVKKLEDYHHRGSSSFTVQFLVASSLNIPSSEVELADQPFIMKRRLPIDGSNTGVASPSNAVTVAAT